MKVGVVADDLTGAADAGLSFARAGFPVQVALWPLPARGPRGGVWAISTESRNLPPAAARRRVRAAARLMRRWKAGFVFKKIDSTLRGAVGAELDGFRDVFPAAAPSAVVPAFPAAGRAVRGGRLFINGVPLHRTAFAKDPRHPRRTDRVAAVLGEVRAARLWIPDAATDADLRAIARRVWTDGAPFAAGSGGFAGAVAQVLGRTRGAVPRPPPDGRGGPVLVVSGSAHPRSLAQADRARAAGAAVVAAPRGRGAPRQILKDVVRRAAVRARDEAFRRFAVTGGETAAALARALGVRRWRVAGQVDIGVPLLASTGGPRTWWVVKPGGFGREDVWTQAIKRFAKT